MRQCSGGAVVVRAFAHASGLITRPRAHLLGGGGRRRLRVKPPSRLRPSSAGGGKEGGSGGAPSEGASQGPPEPEAGAKPRPPAGEQDSELAGGDEVEFGSAEWRKRPTSLALPSVLQSPGAWFCLAGVLKVLFLMYANTPVSMSLSIFGLAPVFGAYLTLIPFAIGLALFAKYCVDNSLQKKRWFLPAALVCVLAILALSSRRPFARRSPQRLRASTTAVSLSGPSSGTATVSVTTSSGSSKA